MNQSEREFHLEEYRELRSEVVGVVEKIETLLRYAVVVAAGVFAWLATQSLGQNPTTGKLCSKLPVDNLLTDFSWWIPTAATLSVGLISVTSYVRINEMGGYLRSLEDALGNGRLGWEKYLSKQMALVTISTVFAWLFVLCSTTFVAWRMQNTYLSTCVADPIQTACSSGSAQKAEKSTEVKQ